jgi:hypothetical protein
LSVKSTPGIETPLCSRKAFPADTSYLVVGLNKGIVVIDLTVALGAANYGLIV